MKLTANGRRWVGFPLSLFVILTACQGGPTSTRDNTSATSARDFSADRLAVLTQVVQADIDAKRIPGAVILIASNGRVVFEKALGRQEPQTGTLMSPNAIFRIRSMTKPIVSVGAMMLVEDGKLLLSDLVSQHLPELKDLKVEDHTIGSDGKKTSKLVPAKQEMTVHDLLRHTSGLSGNISGEITSNDDLLKKLAKLSLVFHPGTAWDYGASIDVLGALIERISGKALDDYLRARILKPLKMEDSGFWVEPAKYGRMAEPFEIDPDTNVPTRFPSLRTRPTFLDASGGMVSTARDYLRFAQLLLNGGQLDGVRILSPKTVELMTSDHVNGLPGVNPFVPSGYGFGLGFAVRKSIGGCAFPGSLGDYTWVGVGGTIFWVDPHERMIAIFMMQAPGQLNRYIRLSRDMVYSASL